MSKLFAYIDTERRVNTRTVPANQEMRIRVNYGSAANSMEGYDLLITENNGGMPTLDIVSKANPEFSVRFNGKKVKVE